VILASVAVAAAAQIYSSGMINIALAFGPQTGFTAGSSRSRQRIANPLERGDVFV